MAFEHIVKNIYIGEYEPTWEESRSNVDTLYQWANGTIKHWYDSNYWEIELKKSNWDILIIADRNIGASTYWTSSSAIWTYYHYSNISNVPTWYHAPNMSEMTTLRTYFWNICWHNFDNLWYTDSQWVPDFVNYILCPLSWYTWNDWNPSYVGDGLFLMSTNWQLNWFQSNNQINVGTTASQYGGNVRPFKDISN